MHGAEEGNSFPQFFFSYPTYTGCKLTLDLEVHKKGKGM